MTRLMRISRYWAPLPVLVVLCQVQARAQGAPQMRPAFRADQFVDFIGLSASPFERYLDSGPFKGVGTKYAPEVFFDLGVRHYRTGLFHDLVKPESPELMKAAWLKYGAQPMLLISPGKTKTPAEVLAQIKRYEPGLIGEIEGPNEVNNKFPPQELNMHYAGKTDEAAAAAFQKDVFEALRGDAATKAIPLVNFTSIFSDYSLARPCDGFDFNNMHSYQGYNAPSSSLLMNEVRANNVLPSGAVIKPFVPTECGYNVEADVANGTHKTGSLRAQALNIPMLLAEYFNHGIRRAYLFALHNADGYGLLESDQSTKRPSYYALQSLIGELRDASWNPTARRWEGGDGFTPRPLAFSLEGAPDTVHTLTLQKKSGEYDLLIWNEVRNFDENAKKDIINPPLPVMLRFAAALGSRATILTQNETGHYEKSEIPVAKGALPLSVSAAVTIVRFWAPAARDTTVPTWTPELKGTATENMVQVTWNAWKAPDLAGYFVFRNGAYLMTTRETHFDDASAWIRPGLGYTYRVQAVDTAGNVSPAAEIVVQTADRRPDLIVSDVVTPQVKAGEAVRFKATLKNIGPGATPDGTLQGLTFFVDGKYVAYQTVMKTLGPGESLDFEADSGITHGVWTAAAGAHLLRVVADDVNRVSGEISETNNVADRSLVVDVPGEGLLQGGSEPAGGQVDLTREGRLDWVHWGLNGDAVVTRKRGANLLSGELEKSGNGYRSWTGGFVLSARWSDGAPTAEIHDTHASLWWNGVGHGYSLTAPADTTERVLRVYVGGIEGARGKLTAHLSDGSAPDFVSTTWNGNRALDWSPVPDGFTAVYTLRYRAASAGQSLKVTWSLDGEPNRFLGQARLQAATLGVE